MIAAAVVALSVGYLTGRTRPYERLAIVIDRHHSEHPERWRGPVREWVLLLVLVLIGPALLARARRRDKEQP
ncbi:hypothetical protein AB0J38_26000 [Streptomyces sp. NPDC050095]|uniref:hypothetical protein n=1 Tax=unclassified Streptomyces TaxID=2593676 RepID=UPI003431A378